MLYSAAIYSVGQGSVRKRPSRVRVPYFYPGRPLFRVSANTSFTGPGSEQRRLLLIQNSMSYLIRIAYFLLLVYPWRFYICTSQDEMRTCASIIHIHTHEAVEQENRRREPQMRARSSLAAISRPSTVSSWAVECYVDLLLPRRHLFAVSVVYL